MEALEKFELNQRIVGDVTTRTLSAIPTLYGRLLYLATLRDLGAGRYAHEGLEATYPAGAVQEALLLCHEEVFAHILETSLEQQEWDLRACLSSLEGEWEESVDFWREAEPFRALAPRTVPSYLRDLFCSNVRALLDLFLADRSTWQAAA